MSRLEIIIGPMFSGKSSTLISRANVFKLYKKILVVNSKKDTRYTEDASSICSHNLESFPSIAVDNLFDINHWCDFDVIIIDECQFFKDLYRFVSHVLKHDKHILIAGLDGCDQQKKFGEILDLIPLADQVTKLSSFCKKCFLETQLMIPAPFTSRYEKRETDEQGQVGGSETYLATCRKHI